EDRRRGVVVRPAVGVRILRPMRTRAAAEREESLRALYDRHAPVLLAYALRLTDGDRTRAEDIVQETLLRAWRFTVAQRLAIDAHRARRARPPEVGDAALVSVPALDQVEGTLDRIII